MINIKYQFNNKIPNLNMTSTSVVIPTFGRIKLALNLARSIRSFHHDIEIIIVDQENQNPPDGKTLSDTGVRYYNLDKANTSVAKNTGWRQARGEVVIFFDDDIEIAQNTIKTHLDCYSDKDVVGVAGRVIVDHESVPSDTDVLTGKTNFLGTKFVYRFWSTQRQTVDFPYGCNMSFRKAILEKVGGFDPGFPKIFEEVDLGVRVSKIGKIVFEPETLAFHHKAGGGGIRPEEKANKQRLIFQNYGRYLAKNIPFPFSLASLFIRSITAAKINIGLIGHLWKNYLLGLRRPRRSRRLE
jgi:GT2 family glycosyltransferase